MKCSGHEDYDSVFDSYFHNDGDLSEFRDFEELKDFVEEHCWEEVEDGIFAGITFG
ncbi:hypothetical protein [Psychrobacillus psychrotolerans]|uniref:hypothetical protein n=1 Tax=Psychrobacillus psychrotolerans TaxID=126156 RepID=UPI003B01BF00